MPRYLLSRFSWAPASLVLFIAIASGSVHAQNRKPLLLRDPSISSTHIAFSHAGTLWVANRDGSNPRRLTNADREARPVFSPDGTQIAFAGDHAGSRSVYVVPLAGGEPRRLTFHPADLGQPRMGKTGDTIGWTPDGRSVLFSSRRTAFAPGVVQLFTVPAGGGFATALPLARAAQASFSPDAARVAYVRNTQWQPEWKGYRGGQTTAILIARLADSDIEATIPRDNSNDFNPMWVGDNIYFLSDRNGSATLFSYDVKSKRVKELVKNAGFDLKSAAASADAIVYEQFGSLHLYDLKSGNHRALDIRPVADFPEVRPRLQNVADMVQRWSFSRKIEPRISPDGASAAFGVRGEILTVPAEKGYIDNLTRTTGAVERDPAWSPDGKSIAYFSDESGEYALHVGDRNTRGKVRKVGLGSPPSFYYSPTWSPDSRKVGYTDKSLNYWYVDLDKGVPVRVDTDLYFDTAHDRQMAWSPDSRWIAYTRQLPSHLHAVFLYSIEKAKSYQLTDGMSDALYVAFDKAGQYLYFTASTDSSMKTSSLSVPSMRRPMTRNVYAITLGKAGVEVDLDGIDRRIVDLPIPARNYEALVAGKQGILFLVQGPQVDSFFSIIGDPITRVHRFDLTTGHAEQILTDVTYFDLSFDGAKMLYARQSPAQQKQWFITSVEKAAARAGEEVTGAEEGLLDLDSMQVQVDPRVEWKHMFEQVWRNQRDFFYDSGLHGLDVVQTKKKYEPFLENISSRDDLDYLFSEMLANLCVDHMTVAGPDTEFFKLRQVKTGLLGADYALENGRYRFARIYQRDVWNTGSRAPLGEPGKEVQTGEYLLAVNGRDVLPSADVFSYFTDTAGKPLPLRVGPNPDGRGSRDISVVPLDNEAALRNFAWVDGNRRTVDTLTRGRVAYVHMPDVMGGGYASFNRYYFAQAGKDAIIVDSRYNGGGSMSDYFIDYLRRPLLDYFHHYAGRVTTTPMAGIFGPKVMIINEMEGSGGDHFPWLFRKAQLGPLIGKRTWGGLTGPIGSPDDLLDGGYVATPNVAFYTPHGTWDINNRGVSPDVEVEEDPKAARAGHDLQLEKAVEVTLDLLQKNPPSSPRRPPYPNHHKSTFK